MSRYEVIVTREEKWWMVRVPAISGLTQARRLAESSLMARELIAVTLDVPIEDIRVSVAIESIGEITDIAGRLARIAAERQRATELERQASAEAVALAKALVDLDIPLRDVGTVLGVSHQRAHQLVTSVRS